MFTDTCAENFPNFELPQPKNVQCPQKISRVISSLSSCNGSKTSPEYNRTLDLHNCFQDVDQALKKSKEKFPKQICKDKFQRQICQDRCKDSCFVYTYSTAKKKNYINFCISEYMTQQFGMRQTLKVLHPVLTICQCQKKVRCCIEDFIEICLMKQENHFFIQRCLKLLLTLCRGLPRQNRTKCKDVIENIIDNKIEEISKTTNQAYVS